MPLSSGTRLGPYEIQSALGAGGMGEVYRARDTRLKRDVALKILPESFAADPDRLARFQREAEVLAALNHPNIAAIYGFEESGATRALVLELVEGDTLAELIARGHVGRTLSGSPGEPDKARPTGLPVAEALPIARQIAEALEAAHEQGVIHRDLKPANIKVTPDGVVKVLDFGLAKLTEAGAVSGVGAAEPLSMSPTITSPAMATGIGVLLGTAAYMAPEQAKGRPADKRSDLWAFGCVLYEMLTGRRPFDGEDLQEVLGAVVRLEPDWATLPADVPPAVLTLLRTCLTKDRRKRTVEATTALFVLDNAATLIERVEAPFAVPDPEDMRAQTDAALAELRGELTRSRRRRIALVGAAAVIAGAVVAGALVWMATRPMPPRVSRFTITPSGATALTINGNQRDLAITPDGSRVVYAGNNGTQLFVRALDALEPVAVFSGTPRGLFVSPDGQWIGLTDASNTLKKVAVTGGPPVTLTTLDGANLRSATWAPDDMIIFATDNAASGLLRVAAAGGPSTVLTRPDRAHGELDHLWPEFLPGGQAVLFTITAATGGLDNAQIAVLDLKSSTYKVLVRGGSHAHYVPTGHLVYGAGGTLRAVAFDLDRLEVVSTPVPVLERVATTAGGAVDVALAANGTMVYALEGVTDTVRSLLWVDRQGREVPIAAPPAAYVYPRLSPDGTRVALDIAGQNRDIWVWDLARETLSRLTSDPSTDRSPTWTRDGRRIVFSSNRTRTGGVFNLFWQNADGTSEAERLIQGRNSTGVGPVALTPDGKRLVFHEQTSTTGEDIMSAALGGEGPAEPLIRTNFNERNPQISPNGLWIAYDSNTSGRFEIYVRPFPDVGRGQWQVSTVGGEEPMWSRDAGELFYRALNGALMGVSVRRGTRWTAGKPVEVVKPGYYAGDSGLLNPTYDVARDGRFLVIKEQAAQATTAPPSIIVVQSWFEELKRLVPVH